MDVTTTVHEPQFRPLVEGSRKSSPSFLSSKLRSTSFEIGVLVFLAVAMRLPWIFMIPISQAPDEGAHYWVLEFLFKNLRLPELSDMVKQADSAYYGALSPFSYVPHLLCAKAMPFFNAPLAYRFGSLLMGVVSVLAARGIGKQLFPKSKLVALAVPLYLIFHPQLAFVNGYSNNDSASMAISTVVIYSALLAVRRGISSKLAIAIGLLSGCLALSKPTSYCIFPVLLAAIVTGFCFHRESTRAVFQKLAIMASLSAALALPFFVRNWISFNGDLLGMRTMLELWWGHWGKPAQLYKWPVVDNADWRYCAFSSYVGNLGNMDKLLPSRIYKLFSLSIFVSIAGWVFASVAPWLRKPVCSESRGPSERNGLDKCSESRGPSERNGLDKYSESRGPSERNGLDKYSESRGPSERNGLDKYSESRGPSERNGLDRNVQIAMWLLVASAFALNFAALVAGSSALNATGPPQGRYLFPSEACIAALIIGGLSRFGRLGQVAVLLFVALTVVAGVISLCMLYPIWHFDVNIFR